MSNIAQEAMQILNDTLYTIQRVSTFADSMRRSSRSSRRASAARFWSTKSEEAPENLVRYAMVDSALTVPGGR